MVLCAALLIPTTAPAAEVNDTFDADAQGWTAGQEFNSASAGFVSPATFQSTGGNPGGFISLMDTAIEPCGDGGNPACNYAFFKAPAARWHGDHSSEYGGTLFFDFAAPENVEYGPVALIRRTSGEMLISSHTMIAPGWNTYRTRLGPGGQVDDPGSGWALCPAGFDFRSESISANCSDATQAQITSVLGSIGGVEILGDVASGIDEASGLDNVGLSATPHDSDGDGDPDLQDNCPAVDNADQLNTDGDLLGDACDEDADGDGVGNFADGCPLTAAATADGCPAAAATPPSTTTPKKCKKGQKLRKGKCVKKKRKKKKTTKK
jgi:hypothetical protein